MDAGAQSGGTLPRDPAWAGAELLIAAALVVAANIYHLVPINETPWLIILGWLSLRRRGLAWRNLGLRRPARWVTTLSVAILVAVAYQLLSEFVTEPILARLTGERPDLSSFQSLVGNLPAALGMLAAVWTLAAFGEEMAYRGYILERAAALGRHSRAAYLVSMVVVSILFGIGHWYQGPAGVIGSAVSGLLFGTLYLKTGRNLWLPILAHGFSDTLGLVWIYLGRVPELRG